MHALLLSAGEGTRLRPLTLKTPKCLLPSVNNEPILKYWIDTLIEIGIDKIFINVWWLGRKIIEYVVYSLDSDIRSHIVIHNELYLEPIGEVLFNLKDRLGDQFLVINSDTYIEKEQVKKFIEIASTKRKVPVYLATEKKDDTKGKGVIVFSPDEDGLITDFVEKPDSDRPGHVWAGAAVMDRSVIYNYTPEQLIKMELARDIFPDLKNRMIGIDVKDVIDIGGSLEVYNRACERFAKEG